MNKVLDRSFVADQLQICPAIELSIVIDGTLDHTLNVAHHNKPQPPNVIQNIRLKNAFYIHKLLITVLYYCHQPHHLVIHLQQL